MRHSLRCYWGTSSMKDIFSLSPNNLTASAAFKRILNPSLTRCRIYPRMNTVILGVHADVWSPFEISYYRSQCVQAGPICTGVPSSTYLHSIGAPGCWSDSISATRLLHCLQAMKAVRERDCLSASDIYHDVDDRFYKLISTGGGQVTCTMFAYGRASVITIPKSMLGGGIGLRVLGYGAVWDESMEGGGGYS